MTMSLSPAFQCPVGGCEVEIPAVTGAVQMLFLETHNRDAHGALQAPLETQNRVVETGAKAQKIQRPSIPEECSETEWAFFIDKWEDYRGFYRVFQNEWNFWYPY